jgi:hypothetical protein
MLDTTSIGFSHILSLDTDWSGGVTARVVKASHAPEKGTGWHRDEADLQIAGPALVCTVDVAPVCETPDPAPWDGPEA